MKRSELAQRLDRAEAAGALYVEADFSGYAPALMRVDLAAFQERLAALGVQLEDEEEAG